MPRTHLLWAAILPLLTAPLCAVSQPTTVLLQGNAVYAERGVKTRPLRDNDGARIFIEFDSSRMTGNTLLDQIVDGKWTSEYIVNGAKPFKLVAKAEMVGAYSASYEATLGLSQQVIFPSTIYVHSRLSWIDHLLLTAQQAQKKIYDCQLGGPIAGTISCTNKRSLAERTKVDRLGLVIRPAFIEAIDLSGDPKVNLQYADALVRLGDVCESYAQMRSIDATKRSALNVEKFAGFVEAATVDFGSACNGVIDASRRTKFRRDLMVSIAEDLLSPTGELIQAGDQAKSVRRRIFRAWFDMLEAEGSMPNDKKELAKVIISDVQVRSIWFKFIDRYTAHGGIARAETINIEELTKQLQAISLEL